VGKGLANHGRKARIPSGYMLPDERWL
jgi:hypothetical protein